MAKILPENAHYFKFNYQMKILGGGGAYTFILLIYCQLLFPFLIKSCLLFSFKYLCQPS